MSTAVAFPAWFYALLLFFFTALAGSALYARHLAIAGDAKCRADLRAATAADSLHIIIARPYCAYERHKPRNP